MLSSVLNPESPRNAELWLATPAAAAHFNADALPPSELDRYSRLTSPGRRREFAVSRSLQVFLQTQEVAPRSLSHSSGHAAVLSTAHGVLAGIDVEVHAPRRLASLARFAFSGVEANALETAPNEQQARLFYALWTLKEAFAKALRLPLLEATRTCTFKLAGRALQGTIPTAQPWSARVFEPRPNVSLAIAVLRPSALGSLRTWEWPPATERQWPEPFAVCPHSSGPL